MGCWVTWSRAGVSIFDSTVALRAFGKAVPGVSFSSWIELSDQKLVSSPAINWGRSERWIDYRLAMV